MPQRPCLIVYVSGNLGIQAFCEFSDCLGNLQIAWAIRDCCVQLDCLKSRRTGKYIRYSAFLLSTLYIVNFLFGILSSRGMEHKKYRKANSEFSYYEKETTSSSAHT